LSVPIGLVGRYIIAIVECGHKGAQRMMHQRCDNEREQQQTNIHESNDLQQKCQTMKRKLEDDHVLASKFSKHAECSTLQVSFLFSHETAQPQWHLGELQQKLRNHMSHVKYKTLEMRLPLSADDIPELSCALNSKNVDTLINATTMLRMLISKQRECEEPTRQTVYAGIVPILVKFLEEYVNHVKFLIEVYSFQNNIKPYQILWALCNIASGRSDDTAAIIKSGAVPILINLLQHQADAVKEQTLWAFFNIAGDSASNRDYVLQMGAMQPVLTIISSNPQLSLLRQATDTLSNFFRGRPIPDFRFILAALHALAPLLFHDDDEVLQYACCTVFCASEGANDRIQAVIDANIVPRMTELLTHRSSLVQIHAVRTIRNIVNGNDQQTQIVLDCNALPNIASLLIHTIQDIRKEACSALSEITAGNKDQIQAVIDANIIPILISILNGDLNGVKKEAAWAVANATVNATDKQIQYLVHCGVIRSLCNLLTIRVNIIVNVALAGLGNILASGARVEEHGVNVYLRFIYDVNGLEKIKSLQAQNKEEWEQGLKILKKYIGTLD
jgi:importin subunit alpha-1